MKKYVLIISVLLCSCVTQADDEWVSLEKSTGQEIFKEKCGMCHGDSMGMGTGLIARRMDPEAALLENRDDLEDVFIETVVRNGFGVMFPMSRGEVSDAQLESIISHLVKD